ncbi:NADH-quinone oxidoreductase subunit NuoE [Flavimobilis sp. GY10621]|uniref:NADH-quinone oxidoreductase subunit NuoE n=1 Tax=Flavimobilis rhizosphaerae TaxID=2775421 RepID=A0ABR9DQU6_9MICO|nr:NADH-quinone oxidoreductase subunit NuoE [Flavimobilis rhizosphaerae]MBD9698697.1 NADH-quinone oxidoreductase subunit NuoE [Flavimobilis rhizosphaerae]
MTTTGYAPEVRARLDADAADIVSRYPQARSALLPLLHLVQSEDGYVSRHGIEFCAETLGLTTASVSAVATFYTQYKRRPNGEYTVGVCTNTLCAIMGGDEIFERLSERLGVGHDETTEDGRITLERVECNAACDFAPVMMINWEFFDNQTADSALEVVDRLIAGEDVTPTRGPEKVVSFKEMSRVLAGFDDGRADEGVAAGGASLVGLEIARDHGWTAPSYDAAEREAAASAAASADAAPGVGEEHSSADRPAGSDADVETEEKR